MTQKNKSIEKKRFMFFQIGMIISLSLVLFAFEWTTPIMESKIKMAALDDGIDIEEISSVIIKRKAKKVKPKPIASMVVIIEDEKPLIANIDLEDEDDKDDVDIPVIEEIGFSDDGNDGDGTSNLDDGEPLDIGLVEIKPYYLDCENILNREEQSACSYAKIRQHIADNLQIPSIAQDIGASGKIYISFEVNKRGNIDKVEIIKGKTKFHPSLEKEAIRVLEALPKMEPASQQGKKVKVRYRIPINIKIR